jgi:hypothetical protein
LEPSTASSPIRPSIWAPRSSRPKTKIRARRESVVLPFREWFDRHVWFLSKDDADVKAELWEGQGTLVDLLEDDDVPRLIILKGRQLGVSSVLAAYVVWHAQGGRGRNVILQSQGEREAVRLLAKCKYVHRRLPADVRVPLTRANDSAMEFGSLDSRIDALPATSVAGRGEGTTLVVADEWAYHPDADENWAAVQPTLARRAKFVGLSSANGRGNFFHRMWEGAERRENGFRTLFLSWRAAPGRDDAWYATQKREYATTPHLLAQEHPDTPAEAFVASGNCVFDVEAVLRHLARCTPPTKTESVPGNGSLRIWRLPEPGKLYVVAADVAAGLTPDKKTSDACAAAVYDASARCCATLHGRWEPLRYAALLFDLGVRYAHTLLPVGFGSPTPPRPALLAVESNDRGSAVIADLRSANYPNLYVAPPAQHADTVGNHAAEFGWRTDRVSKTLAIATLQGHLAAGLDCPDRDFFDECLNFVDQGGGKMGASSGTHDDRVIAHAIALELVPRVRAVQALQSLPFETAMSVA